MLKVANKQSVIYINLARNLLCAISEGASRASLDLLLKQSFRLNPPSTDSIYCAHRGVHFYLDRRVAIAEWLHSEYTQINCLYPDLKLDETQEHMMAYSIGVMQWGDIYLYSHMPFKDSVKVYRIADALSDLSWYHTTKLLPYIQHSAPELLNAAEHTY